MRNWAVLPGEPGKIRLVELPDPGRPRRSQVRVRMLRAPINPADLLVIEGRYAFATDAHAPIGAEGVGVVEEVGEGVSGLSRGDFVLPLARGGWCTYRLIDRSALIVLPFGPDIGQAAMLRINPATALLLLEAAGARAGDLLLQNGATSAVAAWVRFFAGRLGVDVVDIGRRPDPLLPDMIVEAGDLREQVQARVGQRPVCAALDCVAGEGTGRLAACLAPRGRLILFGHLSGEPVSVRSQLLTGGGLSLTGFSLRPAETALGEEGVQRMFNAIWAMLEEKGPVLPIRKVLPIAEAEEAIALARAGGRGRVQLDLSA